jgi:hypothetical protein
VDYVKKRNTVEKTNRLFSFGETLTTQKKKKKLRERERERRKLGGGNERHYRLEGGVTET